MVALRLCLDRIAPPRKDTAVTFDMPKVRSARDVMDASAGVLAAIASGEVTPDEAGRLMALLVAHRGISSTRGSNVSVLNQQITQCRKGKRPFAIRSSRCLCLCDGPVSFDDAARLLV